jgi:lipid II:glycine glycyltransferase (peptidoglycan interpeptide bridge formation enzyme)
MKWIFDELSQAEWAGFLARRKDAHFFQSIERCRMREKIGYQNYIIGVWAGRRIVAGGVLMGKDGEFWLAYGPLIDWDNPKLVGFFLDNLIKFATARKMLKIEVFPDLLLSWRSSKGEILEKWNRARVKQIFAAAGFRYLGETSNYQMKAGRWAFSKDLTGIKDDEELRKTYRKTLRARLRQTEGDVKITTLKRGELGVLVGLIDESDSRNGVKGREQDYYEQIYDAFGPSAEFLVARKADDDTPIAGAIFIYNHREVASYLSGMDRKYRQLNGRAWLQDYVMKKCLKKGIKRVNFFWIEGRFSGNSLLEFKSGFGGVVEEYIGGFEKVLRPAKYLARRVARKTKSLLRQIPSRLSHRN